MANRKPRVWNEEMVARAAGLKRAGFSAKVIADRLGVSVYAVECQMHHKRIKRHSGKKPKASFGPITLARLEAAKESIQDLIDIKGEQ
jgi:orotate phosphoribosyltransferase-like protein